MRSIKSLIPLLIAGATDAYAGSMGVSCSAYNVDGYCANSAWSLGVQALYLQPNSDLYQNTVTLSAGSSAINLGLNPNWSWGFAVNGAFYLNAANELAINWSDLRDNNSKSYSPSSLSYLYPSGTSVNAQFNSVYQSLHLEWDQVNLEYAQHLTLSPYTLLRVHGGGEYSRLVNMGYNVYNSTVSINGALPVATSFNGLYNASYSGFGPRVGAAFDLSPLDGYTLYARAAVAILAGTSKSNVTANQTFRINYNHATVVPELEGRLGGQFTYPMTTCHLNLDLSWMWTNYFNVLTSAVSPASNSISQSTNFGLQGLSMGLQWLGNIV